MILYQNSILTVDYNPGADIMEVVYPDVDGIMLSEVKHSLTIMVDNIRHFDVKKLLIDASKTVITISEEEDEALIRQLAAELAKTRLQKVARIQPLDPLREKQAQKNIERAKEEGLLPYRVKSFAEKTEAIDWLLSPG